MTSILHRESGCALSDPGSGERTSSPRPVGRNSWLELTAGLVQTSSLTVLLLHDCYFTRHCFTSLWSPTHADNIPVQRLAHSPLAKSRSCFPTLPTTFAVNYHSISTAFLPGFCPVLILLSDSQPISITSPSQSSYIFVWLLSHSVTILIWRSPALY